MERCKLYAIWYLRYRTAADYDPSERATYTNVPGRPGSLTTLEGEDVYDDLVLTATCFLSDPSQIPAIAAWLKGSGTVTFANRQGGFYYARVVNQISFEKILRGNAHRAFAVNFRCKPFWYAENVEPITLTESGTFITNPGSVYSEPVITVNGSGDITLMVGMTVVELTGRSRWIRRSWKPIRIPHERQHER